LAIHFIHLLLCRKLSLTEAQKNRVGSGYNLYIYSDIGSR